MSVDLVNLAKLNAARWIKAKITRNGFNGVALKLVAAKPRYQIVERATGVPWFFIAVVHERESSQNFNTQLAQGDPLGYRSIHVPAGRGPFSSWEGGAVDALVNCAPHAARNHDWSIGGLLTMLEEYNGLGYAMRGLPSPYVWSGTDQYARGKYVRDGVYDPSVVDQQLGCAGLLLAMKQLDPSVGFTTVLSGGPTPLSTKKVIREPKKASAMNGITPSQDQIIAQLRILIPILGTIISATGWVSADKMGPIISNLLIALGPLSYLIASIWSFIANSRASIMASAAKPSMPGEEPPQIQLAPSERNLANSLPSNVTVQQP
jgi:lysozyme family protein